MTTQRNATSTISSLHSPQKQSLQSISFQPDTYFICHWQVRHSGPCDHKSGVRDFPASEENMHCSQGTVSLTISKSSVPAPKLCHQRRGCTVTQRTASKRRHRAFMTKRCANKDQKLGLGIKRISFPGAPHRASRQATHGQVHWWVTVQPGRVVLPTSYWSLRRQFPSWLQDAVCLPELIFLQISKWPEPWSTYPLPSSLNHINHPGRGAGGGKCEVSPIPGPASSGTLLGGRCLPGQNPCARGRRGGSCAHTGHSDAGSFLKSRKRIWGGPESLSPSPLEESSQFIT